MKKKDFFLNCIIALIPIVFAWSIPAFIQPYMDHISAVTYNVYPKLLTGGISGILAGIILAVIWIQYFREASKYIWGVFVALIISILMEINLYRLEVVCNGSTGNADLIHLFSGMYLIMLLYSFYKTKH